MRFRHFSTLVLGLLFALTVAQAERPRVYALVNGKIVAAPGKVIPKGAIVIRDGLIEAVGASVPVPPDAVEIDASGKTIYPGLIDPLTGLGLRRAAAAAPSGAGAAPAGLAGFGQRRETPAGAVHPLGRVHPETQASNLIVPFEGDNKDAERYRNMGVTTALVAPESGIFRGESALLNLKDNKRTAELIVKDHIAQHVAFEYAGFGREYPSSLMGAVATFRQVFLDAERYLIWKKRYAAFPGMKRPDYVAAFEVLAPVLDRSRPVIFETTRPEDVLLADRLAREFNVNAYIAGAGQEWELLPQVKATGRTLIVSVAFPDKPKVDDPDEALEVTLRDLRRYVYAPENPKRLHEAGIRFAFTTRGLKNPADFPKNLRKMLDAGLPADVALAALTTVPAEIAGVASVLGTLEPGKIANLFVADGELFGEKTKIQRIYVDGYEYKVEEEKKPKGDPNAVVDPRGTWSVVYELPGGRSFTRVWTIKGARGNYSGTAETQRGVSAFQEVKLEGNMLTVTLPGPEGRGVSEIMVIITGDSFEGTAEQGPAKVAVKGARTSGPEGGV